VNYERWQVQNIGLDKGCENILSKQFIVILFADVIQNTKIYITAVVVIKRL
jgi:hypothetical protein